MEVWRIDDIKGGESNVSEFRDRKTYVKRADGG